MSKTCATCLKEHPESEFYVKRTKKDGTVLRHAHCKSCFYEKYFRKDMPKREARAEVRRAAIKKIVDEAKNVPCMDCGARWPPEAMDLDHVKGTKLGNVSTLTARKNLPLILAEIAKCEVVCACCHRIRTRSRSLLPA